MYLAHQHRHEQQNIAAHRQAELQTALECAQIEHTHGIQSTEYQEGYARFQAALRLHQEARHRFFSKVLSPVQVSDPAKIKLRKGFGLAPGAISVASPVTLTDAERELHARAQQAVNWLQGKISRAVEDNLLVKLRHNSSLTRNEYDQGRGELVLRTEAAITDVLHEFGHFLEHRCREAYQTAIDFVDLRCGNEGWTHLATAFPQEGWDQHEWGREDDFDRVFPGSSAYYVGAWHTNYTELLSSGLELLYSDPVRFAENDPEYFQVLTGILNGSLL